MNLYKNQYINAMAKYDWLSKRTRRSVDELKLWSSNPRLNPDEEHIYLSDYTQDLLSDEGERESFISLLKSISTIGFIQADPIVVWKNPNNDKYYVAEGNRRVLALKLLRQPQKSPTEIRTLVRKCSQKIDKSTIQKIQVSVAPSLEDAEWYINQRHNAASLQKSWSRVQQQRWIANLYDKYHDDIDKMVTITSMSKAEIENQVRILKIKDLIKLDCVTLRPRYGNVVLLYLLCADTAIRQPAVLLWWATDGENDQRFLFTPQETGLARTQAIPSNRCSQSLAHHCSNQSLHAVS